MAKRSRIKIFSPCSGHGFLEPRYHSGQGDWIAAMKRFRRKMLPKHPST